jgi:hypothetical protein
VRTCAQIQPETWHAIAATPRELSARRERPALIWAEMTLACLANGGVTTHLAPARDQGIWMA